MNLVGNPVKIIKHSSTFYKMKLFRKEPQNHQKYIPYSRCYKPPLYLFLRLFGAASIQEFVHFPIFSTVELHFGAASIQERLLFKRGL